MQSTVVAHTGASRWNTAPIYNLNWQGNPPRKRGMFQAPNDECSQRVAKSSLLKTKTWSTINVYPLRGWLSKKINVFKELTPRFRTYELRGQGKKYRKEIISTNPRQKSTSHCPTKTIAKNDHQSLNWRDRKLLLVSKSFLVFFLSLKSSGFSSKFSGGHKMLLLATLSKVVKWRWKIQ